MRSRLGALALIALVMVTSAPLSVFLAFLAPETADAALDSLANEYTMDIGPVRGATANNFVFITFLNPSGSGKYISIDRMRLHSTASSTATYTDFSIRRITAASLGDLVNAGDIPKNHGSTTNSIAQIRTATSSATSVLVTFSGSTDSTIMSVAAPGVAGMDSGNQEVYFGDSDEKLVLSPGEGIAVYQYHPSVGGDVDHHVSLLVSWEELGSDPGSQGEYIIEMPRVELAAAAEASYHTFLNPVGSGKTAVIRRIRVDVDVDAAAVYTVEPSLVRITAASAGTSISAGDVPKKHTSTGNTAMELRYNNVTETQVGGTDASMIRLTSPGAASQNTSRHELYFGEDEEKIVLQAGEGLALVARAAGDVDHLIRLMVEWDEVDSGSTPAAQNEYIATTPMSYRAWANNDSVASFFNRTGTGKVMVIKRVGFSAIATSTITGTTHFPSIVRITNVSGGTTIATSTNVQKKHSGSGTSLAEIRYGNTAALTETISSGTTSSRLLGAQSPTAVGQPHAIQERTFGPTEPLVLTEGQGIALYLEGTGDTDIRLRLFVEWQEVNSAPTAEDEFMISLGPVNGSTVSGQDFTTIFNPVTSGKYILINRAQINVNTTAAASYVSFSLQRISAASGAASLAAADIPKKNTSSSNSIAELRYNNVTTTLTGTADARIISVSSPDAAGAATAVRLEAQSMRTFSTTEDIVLGPGEGLTLYQEAAGDVDLRIRLDIEWKEQTTRPAEEGEFLMSLPPVSGSATNGYVYHSFLNPSTSGRTYIVKQLGMYGVRTNTITGNPPRISVRKISSASGGTSVTNTNFPLKHGSTTASTAEIRHTNVTVSLQGSATSSLLTALSPLGEGQQDVIYDMTLRSGSEIILKPGEGVALYQITGGSIDTNMSYRMIVGWSELDADQSTYRFFNNADAATPGMPLAGSTTPAVLTSAGQAFRLRMMVALNGARIGTSTESYKLQFAQKSGTCDTSFTGETYADVTGATAIAYNNNAAVADGASALATTTDPKNGNRTIFWQTYEEANSFTNASTTAVQEDSDALWDFALIDNGAPETTSYCFRIIRNDGTFLDSYNFIPEIETYTVPNSLPVASAVSIDSGAASVTLTEGTTKNVVCSGTVTDTDGFADIFAVGAFFFRTSIGTTTAPDDNNQYRLYGDAQCVPSGGSGNSETYTCTYAVQHFADPTDAGSPNSTDNWTCEMWPRDGAATGTVAIDTVEIASLMALDVTATIPYGTVNANSDTGATNQTTTVTNTGNRDMDPELSGVAMTDGGSGSIAASQQKYSDTAFTYSGGGTALSGTPTQINLTLPQRTGAVVSDDILWGLGVPNGTPNGSYTGTNTFTAAAGL